MITPQHVKVIIYIQFNIWLLTKHIIPLYNIYSTCIEIRLVETIPRDIYQNIVFPSQQHRISLSTTSYFPLNNIVFPLFEILKI